MRKRLQHKQEQKPAQEQMREQKQEHDPSKMGVEINIHQIMRILSQFIGRGGGPPRLRLGGKITLRGSTVCLNCCSVSLFVRLPISVRDPLCTRRMLLHPDVEEEFTLSGDVSAPEIRILEFSTGQGLKVASEGLWNLLFAEALTRIY